MNWVEQKKHATPGAYGSFYPPNIVKGHVTYTVSPFTQPVMKNWISDFATRIVRATPRKASVMAPAFVFFGIGYFYTTAGVAREHHEKYY